MASSVNFGTQQYFGFDPRTIPGCSMWLDAADSNSLTLSGTKVTTWSDKSGNTSLSQSTASFQPTYVSSGFNGRPTLQFTGVQGVSYQYLQSATTSLYDSISSFTLFAVMRVVSTPPNFPSPISLQNKVSFYLRGLNNASGFTGSNIWTYQGSAFVASPDTIFPYDTNTFSCLSLGATQQFFLNGSNTIASPSFTFGTGTNVSTIVGWSGYNANDGFNGNISEMIVYTSPLTTSQRQQIEGYLAYKWGLQTNVPTGHPFKSAPPLMRAFQPLDVTLPSLWLDAADARTLTLSGSNVTAWTDKTRGTAITIGGSGGLTSTSNDVTTSPARTSYFTVPVDIRRSVTPNLSAFIVYAWLGQSSGTDQVFWGNDNPNNQNRAQFFTFPIFPTINFAYLLAGGLYLINTSVLNTSATQLYTAIEQVGVTNGTAVYVNGALGPAGTGTASSNTSFAGNEILYFGGGETASIYPSYTQFREIVFYSSALTTSQRQQVEGYLAHKWGLRGSLPATHPFRTFFPTTPLFVPTQISGVQIWLDAADATTLTLSGSNVTTWSDKSGNGRNTTTAFGSPTYSTTALNSRPAVSFNSTAFRGNFAFTGTQLHCFIVTAMAQNGAFPRLLSLGNTTQTDYDAPQTCIPFTIDFGTANLRVVRNNTAVNAAFPAFNTPFLGVSAQYANTQEVGVNGQIVPNTVGTGTSAAFGITQYGIGIHVGTNGEQTFVGSIGEILVYGSYLTTSQRQQVEGYLAWKWGLQNNLPSTHPYAKFRP
jgi:hypothetical protein